jgi:CDP-diacylglycerol--glycerol-3-phosphate 3-phosphatidyltransferase
VNAANWVTVGRIILVPVFVALAYMHTDAGAIAALIVFAIASISDRLDGQLARKRGTVSRLGEFLDPLADKLLVGAALYVLVDLHDFPPWAAILIGVRELAIQALRTQVVARGGTLPASKSSKVKTVLQVSMVCWWLYPAEPNLSHWLFLVAGVAITVWTGLEYIVQAMRPSQKVGA